MHKTAIGCVGVGMTLGVWKVVLVVAALGLSACGGVPEAPAERGAFEAVSLEPAEPARLAGIRALWRRAGAWVVEYDASQITEGRILAALSPRCRAAGAAVRDGGETEHRVDRARDGTPVIISRFRVGCQASAR